MRGGGDAVIKFFLAVDGDGVKEGLHSNFTRISWGASAVTVDDGFVAVAGEGDARG